MMEAVPEREPVREPGMRKPRTESAGRKTRTGEMTAAEMHPSSHSHAAEMPAATAEVSTTTAAVPATATSTASSKRR
jgi:hypothetical protein